jgi:hypothetical protein
LFVDAAKLHRQAFSQKRYWYELYNRVNKLPVFLDEYRKLHVGAGNDVLHLLVAFTAPHFAYLCRPVLGSIVTGYAYAPMQSKKPAAQLFQNPILPGWIGFI